MSLGQFAWLKAGRLANMLNLEELAQVAQEHAQANVPEDEDSQGSEPRRGRGRGRGRGRRAGNSSRQSCSHAGLGFRRLGV